MIHMKHILQRFPRMENALWPGGLGPGRWPLGPRAPARQHDAEMLAGCRETAMRKPVKTNFGRPEAPAKRLVKTSVKTTLKKCVGVRENLRENSVKKHICVRENLRENSVNKS